MGSMRPVRMPGTLRGVLLLGVLMLLGWVGPALEGRVQARSVEVSVTAPFRGDSSLGPLLQMSEFLSDEREDLFWKFTEALRRSTQAVDKLYLPPGTEEEGEQGEKGAPETVEEPLDAFEEAEEEDFGSDLGLGGAGEDGDEEEEGQDEETLRARKHAGDRAAMHTLAMQEASALVDSVVLQVAQLSISSGSYAATLELYHREFSGLSADASCADNETVTWAAVRMPRASNEQSMVEHVACSVDALRAAMANTASPASATSTSSSGTKRTEIYEFDHVHPASAAARAVDFAKRQGTRGVVVLYGLIGSTEFFEWHDAIVESMAATAADASWDYVLRHNVAAAPGARDQVSLQGYGVFLDIKKMDYKAMDDEDRERAKQAREEKQREKEKRNADSGTFEVLHGIDFVLLSIRHPELKREFALLRERLEEERDREYSPIKAGDELGEMKPWKMRDLGLQAIQYVHNRAKAGADTLETITDVVHNFPKYANRLSSIKVSRSLKAEVDRAEEQPLFRMMLQPDTIYVNGRGFSLSTGASVFSFFKMLRREVDFLRSIQKVGLTSSETQRVLKLAMSADLSGKTAGGFVSEGEEMSDFRVDIATGSKGNVIFLNNIEKDEMYEAWDPRVQLLTMGDWNLQFIRKNLYNIILVADPSTAEGLHAIASCYSLATQKAPVRFGLVLVDSSSLWSLDGKPRPRKLGPIAPDVNVTDIASARDIARVFALSKLRLGPFSAWRILIKSMHLAQDRIYNPVEQGGGITLSNLVKAYASTVADTTSWASEDQFEPEVQAVIHRGESEWAFLRRMDRIRLYQPDRNLTAEEAIDHKEDPLGMAVRTSVQLANNMTEYARSKGFRANMFSLNGAMHDDLEKLSNLMMLLFEEQAFIARLVSARKIQQKTKSIVTAIVNSAQRTVQRYHPLLDEHPSSMRFLDLASHANAKPRKVKSKGSKKKKRKQAQAEAEQLLASSGNNQTVQDLASVLDQTHGYFEQGLSSALGPSGSDPNDVEAESKRASSEEDLVQRSSTLWMVVDSTEVAGQAMLAETAEFAAEYWTRALEEDESIAVRGDEGVRPMRVALVHQVDDSVAACVLPPTESGSAATTCDPSMDANAAMTGAAMSSITASLLELTQSADQVISSVTAMRIQSAIARVLVDDHSEALAAAEATAAGGAAASDSSRAGSASASVEVGIDGSTVKVEQPEYTVVRMADVVRRGVSAVLGPGATQRIVEQALVAAVQTEQVIAHVRDERTERVSKALEDAVEVLGMPSAALTSSTPNASLSGAAQQEEKARIVRQRVNAVVYNSRVISLHDNDVVLTKDDIWLLHHQPSTALAGKIERGLRDTTVRHLAENLKETESTVLLRLASCVALAQRVGRADISYVYRQMLPDMTFLDVSPDDQLIDSDTIKTGPDAHSAVTEVPLEIVGLFNPLSPAAQRALPLMALCRDTLPNVRVHIWVIPQRELSEIPLKNFYRYVLDPAAGATASTTGATEGVARFLDLPVRPTLTVRLDTPELWNVQTLHAEQDTDNLQCDPTFCGDAPGSQLTRAAYSLKTMLVYGQCYDTDGNPPNGLQLELTKHHSGPEQVQVADDTLVMKNLGYFQLQALPGMFDLTLAPGRGQDLYDIVTAVQDNTVEAEQGDNGTADGSVDADALGTPETQAEVLPGRRPPRVARPRTLLELSGQRVNADVELHNVFVPRQSRPIVVRNFEDHVELLRVQKKADKKDIALLEELPDEKASADVWTRLTTLWSKEEEEAAAAGKNGTVARSVEYDDQRIHVFSLASGHLYERFLKVMMLSVVKRASMPVKFWLFENFLSPQFKGDVEMLAAEYGFDIGFVTYKWPSWLNRQTEQQRIIWGYKILFLDVLFPMNVPKVIYVDADQVVRADLKELWEMDMKGKPYAYTPFCSSRKEMLGYQFWRQGYWKEHLGEKPYHISALYVVDLRRFRRMAVGDELRSTYSSLSKDQNSLANLDQDLPNFAQTTVPIHSLPQEWLWCETWCSEESKANAKTIDLCNNPEHKEPKLTMAKRIIDGELFEESWAQLDREVKAVEMGRGIVTGNGNVAEDLAG